MTREENLAGLAPINRDLIAKAEAIDSPQRVVQDMDSTETRIPANGSLEPDIAEPLTRPVGRPSHKPVVWYKSFLYQAASWKTARLSCHQFRSNEVRLWLSRIAALPLPAG